MGRKRKPTSFAVGEVSRIVGASRRQLAYWDETGLMSPGIKKSSGRGSRRLYSINDIIELKILVRLLKSSLSLQQIRTSFHFIKEQEKPLDSLIILSDGKTIYLSKDADYLVDTLKHGQTVLRIAVQDLISEVQEKVSGIKAKSE